MTNPAIKELEQSDLISHQARRYGDSMKVFCDGDTTFKFGEWRAWRDACTEQQKLLPPADFKGAK